MPNNFDIEGKTLVRQVVLSNNDGSGKEWQLLKCVLANCSPVKFSLFTALLQDKKSMNNIMKDNNLFAGILLILRIALC